MAAAALLLLLPPPHAPRPLHPHACMSAAGTRRRVQVCGRLQQSVRVVFRVLCVSICTGALAQLRHYLYFCTSKASKVYLRCLRVLRVLPSRRLPVCVS